MLCINSVLSLFQLLFLLLNIFGITFVWSLNRLWSQCSISVTSPLSLALSLIVCLFTFSTTWLSSSSVAELSPSLAFLLPLTSSPIFHQSHKHCGPRKGLIRVLLKGGTRRTSKPILQFTVTRPAAHFTVPGKGIFQDGGYYKSHRSSFSYFFRLEKEMNVRRVKEESKREPHL